MRHLHLLILISLLGGLCGCISTDDQAGSDDQGRVNVMTTTVPLGHFVEMVGGDRLRVAVLVQPGTNPHTFEPSPSHMRLIEDADLYVKNGAGLEIWIDRIVRANREMLVVDSSEGVDLIEAPGPDHNAHESILTTDPHIWLSPRNAMIMTDNICDGLVRVDPSNASHYRKNLDAYQERLRALDAELNETFSKMERKEFVVLHPSWGYLARDYGLEQVPLHPAEKEPGPKYLAAIINTAREKNISAIFADPNFNPKSAEIVANEIGGRVVPLNPLAENYLDNMRLVGEEIAASLEA
ncbi:MAG: metal ABC transporter substrate-binding protein [Euryarchaeota archaeon]|nr:metal ABC transporter substrate-binding protein [Euryarchaeota archaeon]